MDCEFGWPSRMGFGGGMVEEEWDGCRLLSWACNDWGAELLSTEA